ncbi:MAG: esterase-like activity of phytase family protein [Hyphomicrobiaceae bacterium]|nr:esterase-like activity of phytase family protein [Hyphomicrobiaceae bacterium]
MSPQSGDRTRWPAGRATLGKLVALAMLAPFAAIGLVKGAAAYVKPSAADIEAEAIEIAARPITSFSRVTSDTRFGKLEFRGGLVLTSSSRNFGGWSGLLLDDAGRNLVAVSDAGAWMTARIGYDSLRRPIAIENARLGSLKALSSKSLRKNRDRDAEALALESGSVDKGQILVAFEGNHRIGRYRVDGAGLSKPLGYLTMPSELKGSRKRDGLEALTVVRGGRVKGALVAIAESYKDSSGNHTGWIWPAIGGTPQRFHLADLGEFNITDAASLDNGDLIVLERRFRWLEGVKMRIRRIAAGELRPGAKITGEVLLEADMSYEIDNMEGLAVHTDEKGRMVLTVVSDDNFNSLLQRTLLLQFTLPSDTPGEARAAR